MSIRERLRRLEQQVSQTAATDSAKPIATDLEACGQAFEAFAAEQAAGLDDEGREALARRVADFDEAARRLNPLLTTTTNEGFAMDTLTAPAARKPLALPELIQEFGPEPEGLPAKMCLCPVGDGSYELTLTAGRFAVFSGRSEPNPGQTFDILNRFTAERHGEDVSIGGNVFTIMARGGVAHVEWTDGPGGEYAASFDGVETVEA